MGSAWARLGLAVGGALLGGWAFGAIGMSAGFLAGSYIGSMVFPTDYETGMPPVHDYPVQSSAVGIPIPIVYGTMRLAGNVLWMSDLDSYQIKHSAGGGKGGGEEQASYETRYRRSFLLAICEGKAEIKRAWKGKTEIELTEFTSYDGDSNSGISTLIGEDYAEYSNLCLAYFEDYELGNTQAIPNFIFEVNTGVAPVLETPGKTHIYTLEQLQAMKDDLTADYELMNDIDASATSGWNGGAGWEPVGSYTTPFSGSFDGRGFTISNLTINRPTTDRCGFFGYTSNDYNNVFISNLKLENINYVVDDFSGALVGTATGAYGNYTAIINCFASGEMECGAQSGGMIGGDPGGGSANCFKSMAAVNLTAHTGSRMVYCGGFTGSGGANFTDCYATGNLNQSNPTNLYCGGFAGVKYSPCVFTRCYSCGSIPNVNNNGGFLGYHAGAGWVPTFVYCYWDKDSSGKSYGCGDAVGGEDHPGLEGKTTTQMKQQTTYVTWDFVDVWNIQESVTRAYLEIDYDTTYSVYIGTDESPSGDDLFEVDYYWNKHHSSQEGQATNGIYDIVIQPSTDRIIVAGNTTRIYESNWTYVGTLPSGAITMLIDPDDDDYVYCCGAGGIWKYKISTQVEQWSNTSYSAYGVCISSDTGKLYICGVIGDGINEINRSTGAWVRNLELTRGHSRIAYHNNHIYATGSRQGGKSVWRYNETTGAVIDSYDTGDGTNRVIVWGEKIFVCGKRSGLKTIWKFSGVLALEKSYDDGNAVYWLNDMEIDTNRDELVVTSKGNAVDQDGNTANVRWFNSSLELQDHTLIYDNLSTCVVTAFESNSFAVVREIPVDMNFARMIKDLLTNKKCGNYDVSDLITEDFSDIIDYCDTNNLKGSLVITAQKPLPDWIAYICSHFQGYFYEIGGKVGLNCYRSQASVLSIVQDDFVRDGDEPPVHTTKRDYSATFNRLEATWTNRANLYKTAVVPAFDRIDQRESGQVRTKTLDLKAITDATLASKMAWRIFIDQIYRFSQYSFKLGYKSMLLEVGDVIDVTDGHKLVAKKMRVMSVNEEKDGRRALVTAVEDIADFYPAIGYAIQESEASLDTPITLTDGTIIFRESYNSNKLHMSIIPGGTQCNGFYIYRSYDNASFDLVGKAAIENVTGGEANSTGTIQSQINLPAHTAVVYCEDEFFDVSIGTLTDLDTAITDDNFFNNRKLARIGDEIIAYQTCVESAVEGTWRVSKLIRGLFGTKPVAHVAGETFSTLDIDFSYPLQESEIGKTLYFKIVSFYGTKIQLLSEVSSQSYTVSGSYVKPLPVSLMRINGREGLTTYKTADVTIDWYFCSKVSGFGRGGYGNALWGAYSIDPLLERVKVELEEEDGTPITDATYALSDFGDPVQLEILEADRAGKNPVRVKMTPGSFLLGDETRDILIEKI